MRGRTKEVEVKQWVERRMTQFGINKKNTCTVPTLCTFVLYLLVVSSINWDNFAPDFFGPRSSRTHISHVHGFTLTVKRSQTNKKWCYNSSTAVKLTIETHNVDDLTCRQTSTDFLFCQCTLVYWIDMYDVCQSCSSKSWSILKSSSINIRPGNETKTPPRMVRSTLLVAFDAHDCGSAFFSTKRSQTNTRNTQPGATSGYSIKIDK